MHSMLRLLCQSHIFVSVQVLCKHVKKMGGWHRRLAIPIQLWADKGSWKQQPTNRGQMIWLTYQLSQTNLTIHLIKKGKFLTFTEQPIRNFYLLCTERWDCSVNQTHWEVFKYHAIIKRWCGVDIKCWQQLFSYGQVKDLQARQQPTIYEASLFRYYLII